ncbi:hypothetical protein [Clostridium magnum]|nr:hypothetical protein [Clostridium magnum]
MGMIFFSNLKLPGRELPDNMLWQIDEREFMTVDDYDTIINKGFTEFQNNFYATKINKNFPKGTCVFETDGTTDIYPITTRSNTPIFFKVGVKNGYVPGFVQLRIRWSLKLHLIQVFTS